MNEEEMRQLDESPIEQNLFTKEKKREWWGEGEWVNEIDYMSFCHEGIHCEIKRIMAFEQSGHAFGGHWCGYCMIPKDHPDYDSKEDDFDLDYQVHGGITSNGHRADEHWIGFDCAHSGDLMPSLVSFKKKYPSPFDIDKKFQIPEKFKEHSIFNPTYKNLSFVLEETKSLAEQIKEKSIK